MTNTSPATTYRMVACDRFVITDTGTGETESITVEREQPTPEVDGTWATACRHSVIRCSRLMEDFLMSYGTGSPEGDAIWADLEQRVDTLAVATGATSAQLMQHLGHIVSSTMAARNAVMVDLTGAA